MTSVSHNTLSVVLIDDDDEHRDLLTRAISSAFTDEAWDVTTSAFRDPEQGLAELPADNQTIVLIDYSLDGTTGNEWIADFIRAQVGPVILITSHGDETIAREAFRYGAADYLIKPDVIVSPDILRSSVCEALRQYRLEATNRSLSARLKRTNTELERKNARLAELTSIAHRFVDDVAHEFRTPLAVIKEFASILSDGIGGEVTETQREYLDFISSASRDLAGLVDDFLDSSKLRSHSLRVDRRGVRVAEMIDSVWPLLESRASARGISLRRDISSGLPIIFADQEKAGRCLINLVVNAVKFSPSNGAVTIAVEAAASGGVKIEVRDQGPGLPPAELSRLFDRFHQTGSAAMVEAKGFGLGLSIVQQLTALNLGQVDVHSTEGKGSCFAFTLPGYDCEPVVDAVLERAAVEEASPHIAVLDVALLDGLDIASVIERVALSCYSSDVIWPARSNGHLLIIGATRHVEEWRSRVLDLVAEGRKPRDSSAGVVREIRVAGQWPIGQARDELLRLMAPVYGEPVDATLDSDR